MGRKGSFIKRVTDLIISIIVLIVSFPILIIAAIAIKIESPGPVFFIHDRIGYGGKIFKLIKFRGMVNNALSIGPALTQVNDPRLTKTGKFLRRTSIDEIPNLINVLKGEMSIVGPRPEMPFLTFNFTPQERKVFNYKPGLTGISQVNGRQKLTPEQRAQMEVDYYEKADFFTDLLIVFKTIKVVISNEGNI